MYTQKRRFRRTFEALNVSRATILGAAGCAFDKIGMNDKIRTDDIIAIIDDHDGTLAGSDRIGSVGETNTVILHDMFGRDACTFRRERLLHEFLLA